jgi:hypothetical protein
VKAPSGIQTAFVEVSIMRGQHDFTSGAGS